jgi:hypothetical protein
MAQHCTLRINNCLMDHECRKIFGCYASCNKTDSSCFFICEVTYGLESVKYQDLADCLVDHGCLQEFEPDGKCRVTDLDGLKTVTTVEEIAGDWWVVRGLNPHYDSYACQHNRYERLPDGTWINNVTWMNTYKTPPVEVRALPIVTVSYPGVFLHNYTSLRQLENWVVVSRPTKDYMFMLWCGENKELKYAGGIVVSPHRVYADIPKHIEREFRLVARDYGLDYDNDLFPNDNRDCNPN